MPPLASPLFPIADNVDYVRIEFNPSRPELVEALPDGGSQRANVTWMTPLSATSDVTV